MKTLVYIAVAILLPLIGKGSVNNSVHLKGGGTFISVNISIEDNAVVISWQLTDYHSGSIYVIERSENGIDFSPIDTTYYNSPLMYSKDANPIEGISYYRIREVLPDNSEIVSDIYDVEFISAPKNEAFEIVQAYPMPFQESLNMKIKCKNEMLIAMNIFNMKGEILCTVNHLCEKGTNCIKMTCHMQHLECGTYNVIFSDESSKTKTIRIVKQKNN